MHVIYDISCTTDVRKHFYRLLYAQSILRKFIAPAGLVARRGSLRSLTADWYVCSCKVRLLVTALILKVIPLIISSLYDKPQISLQMVGFVKVDPIEAMRTGYDKRHTGPTDQVSWTRVFSCQPRGRILEGSEADGRGRREPFVESC